VAYGQNGEPYVVGRVTDPLLVPGWEGRSA